MTSKRPEKGRGLFYTRDSGGQHEQTPAQYVEGMRRQAETLGITFDGSGEIINQMIARSESVRGDIYLDYVVEGHLLSRPALDALQARIQNDRTVSHVLIPRRDRLSRPQNALDGVQLEQSFRSAGVTVIYFNLVLAPLSRRQRPDIGEMIAAVVEFDQSGKFRKDLAEKMIYAQLELARNGYSTGGRAPFGFCRSLVRSDGSIIRRLHEGEVVRQKGCHVIWVPGTEEEIALCMRIRKLVVGMPASRVAAQLNSEGIPSPDAGRNRRDNGVKHRVSGLWHQSTVLSIARNPLFRGVKTYGERSMGDQQRMSPAGPRNVNDDELLESGKPRVIRNRSEDVIRAPAGFEPVVEQAEQDQLDKLLDQRGGTQRGKPRSRDPENNPLGGRIYDLACTWPMYRLERKSYNGAYRYTCGLYQQSHSAQCAHNHVDGRLASKFVLAAIRQRVLCGNMRNRLEQKLKDRLATQTAGPLAAEVLSKLENSLAVVRSDLATAKRNLARAGSDEQYQAVSQEFETLFAREKRLAEDVANAQRTQPAQLEQDTIGAAMTLLERLPDLVNASESQGDMGRLFQALNVQLYLRFRAEKKQKRTEQKLQGGLMTLGDAPAPITKYDGPTSRRTINIGKKDGQKSPVSPEGVAEDESSTGEEEKSSGNVSRGDRI